MALSEATIAALRESFAGRLLTRGDSEFDEYVHDATEIDHAPDLVIFPESTEEVALAAKLSRKHRFPLIARGAGTGYSGGAVATEGGVILSIERMNQIEGIDPEERTALVQPGVITYDLDLAANEYNLFYPPDPASYKESTLAGNLAECAGGLRCVKYGVTKDYVLGIEYVDYEGSIRTAGSLSASDDMFDVTSLMVGSEGTLGIVTRIQLRLLPRPKARSTFFCTFANQVDAARAVTAIRDSGVIPCVMEFMDGNAIDSVTKYLNLSDMPQAAAMLLVEIDGTAEDVDRDSRIVTESLPKFSPLVNRQTTDDDEREKLWEIRRELSTAVKEYSKIKTSEDVCVPVSRFADIVTEISRIGEKHGLHTASFGHAGDGNLHVCFIIPELSDDILHRMESAKTELLNRTLDMGGTISGEHGIGFTKKDFLEREVGEDVIDLFKRVKRSFDPDNLINPGKMF